MHETMIAWISGFFSGAAIALSVVYAVGKFRDMRDEDKTTRVRHGEWLR